MNYSLLLLITLIPASGSICVPEKYDEEKEFVHFAKSIYQNECKYCRTALIIHTPNDQSNKFLKTVAEDNPATAFLTLPVNNLTLQQEFTGIKEKSDFVFAFLDANSINISFVVFQIEILSVWNPRAKHLFLVTGLNNLNYQPWLEESFKSLWERQVLRSIIGFHLEGRFKIFTYDPFLGQYDIDVTSGKSKPSVFMGRIKNMHGYPLRGYHLDAIYKNTLITDIQNGKTLYKGFDGKYTGTLY